MRIFSELQSAAKQQTVAVVLVLFLSAIGVIAQTGTQRAPVARPAPPFSTGSGIGAATGAGMGAATGVGMGAATGHGVGRANGSGIGGGPTDIVILPPSAINVFKTRHKKANATDIRVGARLGVNGGRGVAPAEETTSGIGEATGNGTADTRTPIEKTEPKRDYMQETDGKCFYVTNQGEKQYVSSSKCKIE